MSADAAAPPRSPPSQQEATQQRTMLHLTEADAVVTHSTRYAIVLRYEPAEMDVPLVLARGMDRVADRIREVARLHLVPCIEDPLLAEALYHHTQAAQPIPSGLYQPVARVMSYVERLRYRCHARYVPLRKMPEL